MAAMAHSPTRSRTVARMVVCAVVEAPRWMASTRRRPTRLTRLVKRTMSRVMMRKTPRIAMLAQVERDPSSSAMTRIGPTSPTAPWLRIEAPTAVGSRPRSRRIGRIVPMAVEVIAVAMAMPLADAAPPVTPMTLTAPKASPSESSQATAAWRPPAPRSSLMSIS